MLISLRLYKKGNVKAMDFTEKTLSQKYHFKGKIMSARVDEIELPNGKKSIREVCEHVGGVGVLPIDENGNIILVRQFRYPYKEVIYEIPAGKLDHGAEDIESCGRRELKEETGYTAENIISLGQVYPSAGFLTEIVYLYAATGLKAGETQPDEDEFVECVSMPFSELEQKIANDEIRDAKTVMAAYRARLKGLIK